MAFVPSMVFLRSHEVKSEPETGPFGKSIDGLSALGKAASPLHHLRSGKQRFISGQTQPQRPKGEVRQVVDPITICPIEQFDESFFDSLDCLGDEFLGSSAADFSTWHKPRSTHSHEPEITTDNAFSTWTHMTHDKGTLNPLPIVSDNSHADEDFDEIHFGSSPVMIPVDRSRTLVFNSSHPHQCLSTPDCQAIQISHKSPFSPAAPVSDPQLEDLWDVVSGPESLESRRTIRDVSQESDASVVLQPFLTNVQGCLTNSVLQEAIDAVQRPQTHTIETAKNFAEHVSTKVKRESATKSISRDEIAPQDRQNEMAQLANLPDLIQPTNDLAEKCKRSIQSVLGKRKLGLSGQGSAMGSLLNISQPGLSLEAVLVQAIQYASMPPKDNLSTKKPKGAQSVAKRQEALKAQVEEMEADNLLLRGCFEEFRTIVKAVLDQNQMMQEGLTSTILGNPALDKLYMTANADRYEKILNGELESGSMTSQLINNLCIKP